MSRRCERRASRGAAPLYHQRMWLDLLLTWKAHPHAFLKGCGQSTMARWVYLATRRSWPSHHLRRVLHAAVESGRAIQTQPGGWSSGSSFRIISVAPLPMRWDRPVVTERWVRPVVAEMA